MAGTGSAHLRDTPGVLRVSDLVVEYPAGRGATVHAVSGISFDVLPGETLGIVGESGCGKSSAGRALMQLPPPTSGSVLLDQVELTSLPDARLRQARSRMQMIFQDPISSLNPRRKVHDIVAEPIQVWEGRGAKDVQARVEATLEAVGLDPVQVWNRRAHELSGGQCQRLCIARTLVLDPLVVICDEPVSALDVSVQAQILNLLEETKQRYGLSLVFIAHDLAVVKNISDRVMVMYLGKVCEVAGSVSLYQQPAHPYTRLLLASVPEPDPDAPELGAAAVGELPSPLDPPSGCRFRTRCDRADDHCAAEEPQLTAVGEDHWVACHHPHTEPVAVALPAGATRATPVDV
jgi:peptide/nickel transport system ATP-binding protein